MNAMPLDRIATLADGRRLGFAEVGDPAGTPVVFCHGFPGSRLESRLVAAAALRAGARLVAPDRPGYGLSDPKPGRALPDFADDVTELAGVLGLDRFRVLGVSGGGPYALALARRLPERVEAVAVVCGLGPLSRPEALAAMHWPARLGFGTARSSPRLNRLLFGEVLGRLMRLSPEIALALLTVRMPARDRQVLARPEVRAVIRAALWEGVRQGPGGPLLDMALYAREWPFDPAGITAPASFWHGEADATVPLSHTRLVAAALPEARVHIVPGEGHFSLPVDHAEAILENLLTL